MSRSKDYLNAIDAADKAATAAGLDDHEREQLAFIGYDLGRFASGVVATLEGLTVGRMVQTKDDGRIDLYDLGHGTDVESIVARVMESDGLDLLIGAPIIKAIALASATRNTVSA